MVVDHHRLLFDGDELARLRARRDLPVCRRLWRNVMEGSRWRLTRPLRTEWIGPVSPDPDYLNLYDRFYAMMHDMAVMEHLSFGGHTGQDSGCFAGACDWLVSCGWVWRTEAGVGVCVGELGCVDPMPMRYPLVTVEAEGGAVEIVVKRSEG